MDQAKIILIEDELFIHDLYRMVLEKAGYHVIGAFDGEEGIHIIRQNPDTRLVLLDIMLPKMHGIDVLRLAKSEDAIRNVPIVLLSNLGEESIIKEAIAQGARDYIKKVYITPQQLVVCVGEYLQNPEYKFDYTKLVG